MGYGCSGKFETNSELKFEGYVKNTGEVNDRNLMIKL